MVQGHVKNSIKVDPRKCTTLQLVMKHGYMLLSLNFKDNQQNGCVQEIPSLFNSLVVLEKRSLVPFFQNLDPLKRLHRRIN
jgi:hypothetical protein